MSGTVKHAPGPWALDEVVTQCGRAFRIGAGEMLTSGKGCCIIYDDYPGNPDNERAANARLITAAPDLLEALKALQLQALQSNVNSAANEWGREALELANAAIAKAEGQS